MALFKKIVLKKVFAHFSAIFIYLLILKKFDYFSLIYTQKNSIFFEGPLALFVYYVFFLIMKPGRFRYVLAFIPAIFFYILFEIYYRTWGSTFKIITIKQLPELFEVLEFSHSILFVSLSITFFTIFVIFFDYRNKYKLALTFLTVVTIAMIFKFLPGTYVDYLQAQSVDISSFSDIESVQKNGRLFMVLYWEAKRRQAIASLQEISGEEDIVLKGLLQSAKLKKNVHIIVMESLFDPSLMINVKFSIVPIHPEFLKLFRDIGTSRSPVFGGRSAQAEFEVLCGEIGRAHV